MQTLCEGRCPFPFPGDRHPLAGATNTNMIQPFHAGCAGYRHLIPGVKPSRRSLDLGDSQRRNSSLISVQELPYRSRPTLKHSLKSFLRGPFGRYVVATYLRLVYYTSRKIIEPKIQNDPASTIYANWHGQNFLFPFWFHGKPRPYALVALHGDGQMIGGAVGILGLKLIHGSGNTDKTQTGKGGARAFLQMLRALRGGESVLTTADVPKEALKVGEGILLLARKSGAPIVPVAIATSNRKILRNWDKTQLHLPFSRLAYVAGPEIKVPDDGSPLAGYQAELKAALDKVQARAFALADRTS